MRVFDARPIVFEYLSTPLKEREPLTQFRKKHTIHRDTYATLKREYQVQLERDIEVKQFLPKMVTRPDGREVFDPYAEEIKGTKKLGRPKVDPNYNSEKYLNGRTRVVDEALIKACDRGSGVALTTFYKLNKRLVEQQEIKVGITADERIRRELEAERELKQWEQGGVGGQGTSEVSEEPPLLPN